MMLQAVDVGKSYGREKVLSHVSLGIDQKEILGIVGQSGCGKSTLARILCCYELPDEGKVLLRGKDTAHRPRNERQLFHKSCQLILQDSLSSMDPTMTIGDTLHETLKYNGCPDRARRQEKIEKYLDMMMLTPELLTSFPAQLSGGERQRISICRALLVEPELLICDEITSSLDVITQFNLLSVLKDINRRTGLPLIFISHNINAVKSISDRILVMHGGTVTEELKKSEGFAGRDGYTKRLFESLPIDHPSKRQALARHFDEQLFKDEIHEKDAPQN